MFIIRTKLAPSPIHGLGTFAGEPIKKGQLVWVFDQRFDLVLTSSDLKGLPTPVRQFILEHAYAEERNGRKVYIFSADDSKYMNHSEFPNVIETNENLSNIAARDIAPGEELTCDYRAFDLMADDKLMAQPEVVGGVPNGNSNPGGNHVHS